MGKESINSGNVKAFVYGLLDPDGFLRYVGKTKLVLSERLDQHCRDTKKTHKGRWIRSLLKSGKKPSIFLIEECESEKVALENETFYVRYFRYIGCKLTNSTDGGEGVVNPTAQARLNMSLSHLGKKLGKYSESHRKKIAEGNRGKKLSSETKQKISLSKAGTSPWNLGKSGYKIVLTCDGRARKIESAKNRKLSKESRMKISQKARGRKLKPLSSEQKKHLSDKLRGRIFSEEHCRNISRSKMRKTSEQLHKETESALIQEKKRDQSLAQVHLQTKCWYESIFLDQTNQHLDLEPCRLFSGIPQPKSSRSHPALFNRLEGEFLGISCKICHQWIDDNNSRQGLTLIPPCEQDNFESTHARDCPVRFAEDLLKEIVELKENNK